MDGQLDGWLPNGCMNGQLDDGMEELLNRQMMNGWLDRLTDVTVGHTDEWKDGQMNDRSMDRWTDR